MSEGSQDDDELLSPQRSESVAKSTPTQNSSRKRKKTEDGGGDGEPRRLRRSHEACARCRAKKIKCDSQHPRCGSCAAAGVTCQQEDRHRNTFMPRGHLERLERQIAQCEQLLRKFIPDFTIDKIEMHVVREGLPDLPPMPIQHPPGMIFAPSPMYPMSGPPGMVSDGRGFPLREVGPGQPPPPSPYMYPPTPHGYYAAESPMGPPPGYPHYMPPLPHQAQPHPHPHSHPHPPQIHPPPRPGSAASVSSVRGQDPQGHDMTNVGNLVKGFGVSSIITNHPAFASAHEYNSEDKEDLAVGLHSGRETILQHPHKPKDQHIWIFRDFNRGQLPTPHVKIGSPSLLVYLPRDREMAALIVNAYFERLNYHRPVFEKDDFNRRLQALYDSGSTTTHDDPGFLCSVYLIFALGTLSQSYQTTSDSDAPKALSESWPSHDEFFEQALVVKPELRVTISSLQALILLHWYLYCERHGRTLWRLAGSMVRLAIELGLHHNPRRQGSTFTHEEGDLRIRLWWIVMIHDRGTAVLLGRPIAIAQEDFDTPAPTVGPSVSEHFVDSKILTDVQADIINSLYRPGPQSAEELTNQSKRILLFMTNFRKGLREPYHPYFEGTLGWTDDQRENLRQTLTFDIGITFLKYAIARLVLLRAVFTNKEVNYNVRRKALDDAIRQAHNVIVVHAQLIKIPDISLFTSPIPLHIAAMTILFGYISRNRLLPKATCVEDVWLALGLLPDLRWRWERKDANGGAHPIMINLAEKVFPEVDYRTFDYSQGKVASLLPEEDWEEIPHPVPAPKLSPQSSAPDFASGEPITLENVPPGLFFPGPAWPQAAGAHASLASHHTNGETANSTTAHRSKIPHQPQRVPSGYNGQPQAPEEWRSILASLPHTMNNPARHQPEPEFKQLYMQEERDPMPDKYHQVRVDNKFVAHLQSMLHVPPKANYPTPSSSHSGH